MADYVDVVQKKLGELAGALEDKSDAISASRIRQLMIALGGDPTAEDWRSINIQSVIDPAAIAEGIRSRAMPTRKLGFLEWLRNALILLPLMFTWLGISQASQKYQDLVNSDSKQELHSFIFLWQQGFNHTLNPFFILNNLALWDFGLLLLIFVLTLAATWRHNLFNAEIEKYSEQLRLSLSHALGDAALCLARQYREQQSKQPSNLNEIARHLSQFTLQFEQTTQQFLNELAEERKRRGDMTAFTAALDKMSKDMLAAATSIYQTNNSLTTTLQDLLVPAKEIPKIVIAATQAVGELNTISGEMKQLIAEQGKWRQELQSVLAQELSQLVAEQKRANQDIESTLDTDLRQLNTSLGQQTAVQKQDAQNLHALMRGSFNQLLNERQQDAQKLHTLMSDSFNQLLGEEQKLSQAVITATTDLESSILALGRFVQDLGKAAGEQTQVLTLMQGLETEQKKLTGEMATATAEIKNVLKAVRESAPELRSMSIDIDKFVQALRAIPNALNADLLAPLQHYSSAAAKINTGSEILSKAAQHLENATQKLDGRLKV